MTSVSIICTGSELLNGSVADTNSHWLIAQLAGTTYAVQSVNVVGDDVDEIADVIARECEKYDCVVCCGGLGPTTDDVTAEAAAKAFGDSLVTNAEAARQVTERFAQRQRKMVAVNLKQAVLPCRAAVLENPAGTAPGFVMRRAPSEAIFLPGVPRELKAMCQKYLFPRVQQASVPAQKLHLFGIGESQVQEHLISIEQQFSVVNVGYRADFPVLTLTLSSEDAGELQRCNDAVRAAVGGHLFSTATPLMAAELGMRLAQKKMRLATAESCTGGMISHLITDVPGSSMYHLGGVVAYDNAVKERVLGVDAAMLAAHGAVSEPVVRQMALGVAAKLRADVALATSGIAGPGGGSADKPVGTVHIAVAFHGTVVHAKHHFTGYARDRFKLITAYTAMQMALDLINR